MRAIGGSRRTSGGAARRSGLALLAIGFGLIVSRGSIPPVEPLAIVPVAPPPGGQVIEIALPAAVAASDCLVMIGSLEDAGTTAEIEVELFPAAESARGNGDQYNLSAADDTEFTENFERGQAVPEGQLCKPFPPHEIAVEGRISDSTNPSRNFFVQTGGNPHSERSYQPVTARLVAESEDVRLWLDMSSMGNISSEQFAWFLDCSQHEVLPAVRDILGDITDVDGDGKLSVCFTPRLDDLPATESLVEGLVQANDFTPELPRPFSNQADVMFLSPRLEPGSHAKTIMLHEAAHLAVFSHRRAAGAAGLRPEADWLNEGMAHFVEVAGGGWSNLDRRLTAFARNPADAALVVTDAQRQGLWRHAGSRAASWLFLAWLADEQGPRVIADVSRHPGIGCDKLEEILGRPFPELFRKWSVDLGRHSLRGSPESRNDISACHSRMQRSTSDRIDADIIDADISEQTRREACRIQPAAFSESATESRMAAGLRRAGTMNVVQLDRDQPRRKFALRGTAVQIVRCELRPGGFTRLRLHTPDSICLQVTALERTTAGERIRAIR